MCETCHRYHIWLQFRWGSGCSLPCRCWCIIMVEVALVWGVIFRRCRCFPKVALSLLLLIVIGNAMSLMKRVIMRTCCTRSLFYSCYPSRSMSGSGNYWRLELQQSSLLLGTAIPTHAAPQVEVHARMYNRIYKRLKVVTILFPLNFFRVFSRNFGNKNGLIFPYSSIENSRPKFNSLENEMLLISSFFSLCVSACYCFHIEFFVRMAVKTR